MVHFDHIGYIQCIKLSSFRELLGPYGSADLQFYRPQLGTSRSCNTMDTGHCVSWCACLLPVLTPVPIYTAW